MKVADKVKTLILEHYAGYDVKLSDLRVDARFQVDLPDDTLGIVELFMMCEEAFAINISDAEAEGCITVGKLIECVESKVREKPFLPDTYEL
jgi:acyl carrier protein